MICKLHSCGCYQQLPFLFSTIGAGAVFLIFAIMMVFQLLFVIFIMPETKGNF
ncbi:MFS transporter [Flavobacterium sp. SLB02]|uniref:MFS transporter n=1 Tax=Flavobacterium sp. SLB02 TaxID=2665645 RepID=UPI00351B5551